MQFPIHTGQKKRHLNYITVEKSVLAHNKPKKPRYVGRDAEGEITNRMVMARMKTEERQLASETKSPRKKKPIRYPFNFNEKRHNRKSLEGRFQSKIQTAICGTENTAKTYGKSFTPNNNFGTFFPE